MLYIKNQKQMKGENRYMIKRERGITLIALIITIVILIILSTIAINYAIGDNSLIKQAELAKDMSANSTAGEEEKRNELAQELEEMIPFEPIPTPEPPSGGKSFSRKYGVIEVKFLHKDTNYESDYPNGPVVDEKNGMKLIKYDEQSKTWVEGKEYNYVEGSGTADNNQSKWANAKVTINGIDSYFVWIPRYAYRIVYFKDETSKNEYRSGTLTEEDGIEQGKIVGYSDSRGIVDTSGKKINGVASYTGINVGDYFTPHPAFTSDVNMGGWSDELKGIWVGKFETSWGNATAESMGSVSSVLKVVPGVISLKRGLKDIYPVALQYNSKLNSHMLKPSEWGAVAYFTDSKYGRNGNEVTINNSGKAITGSAGNSVSADWNVGTTNDYTSEQGVLASTTGNVYGIYDLSGGRGEFLTGFYNAGTNGVAMGSLDGKSNKYATAYNTGISRIDFLKGDIFIETGGWYSDAQDFDMSGGPWCIAGGKWSTVSMGLFSITDCGTNFSENIRIGLCI